MTHAELIDALRATDGLVDVTGGHSDLPSTAEAVSALPRRSRRRWPVCRCQARRRSGCRLRAGLGIYTRRAGGPAPSCAQVCSSRLAALMEDAAGDLVDRPTTGSTLTRTESAGADRGSGLDGDDGGEPDTRGLSVSPSLLVVVGGYYDLGRRLRMPSDRLQGLGTSSSGGSTISLGWSATCRTSQAAWGVNSRAVPCVPSAYRWRGMPSQTE